MPDAAIAAPHRSNLDALGNHLEPRVAGVTQSIGCDPRQNPCSCRMAQTTLSSAESTTDAQVHIRPNNRKLIRTGAS